MTSSAPKSGATGGTEVCFDLDAAAFSNDEFRILQFKARKS